MTETTSHAAPHEPPPAAAAGGLAITERAQRRIAELRRAEGDDGLMLRIGIAGGGCSGFQYSFSLDRSRADDDRVFEENGVRVVVDETSFGLLAGARLDFVEDLVGAFFRLDNPNAKSSCGCGSSFAI